MKNGRRHIQLPTRNGTTPRKILEMKLDAQVRISEGSGQSQSEMQALRSEVKDLREALHAQVITMDSLISKQAQLLQSPEPKDELRGRLGGGDAP